MNKEARFHAKGFPTSWELEKVGYSASMSPRKMLATGLRKWGHSRNAYIKIERELGLQANWREKKHQKVGQKFRRGEDYSKAARIRKFGY